MTSIVRSRIARVSRAAAPLAGIAAVASLLLSLPPAESRFYPRCPIYEYLHLQCPGCGTTRALAALLRGHFSEAMRFNALATLLLPLAAIYGVLWYLRFLRHEPLRWPQLPPAAIYCAFGVTTAFTILRNLPLQFF